MTDTIFKQMGQVIGKKINAVSTKCSSEINNLKHTLDELSLKLDVVMEFINDEQDAIALSVTPKNDNSNTNISVEYDISLSDKLLLVDSNKDKWKITINTDGTLNTIKISKSKKI